MKTNEIRLTWLSEVGVNYFVQGKTSIVDAVWANIAGPTAATTTNSSYCISRPTPLSVLPTVAAGGETNQPPLVEPEIVELQSNVAQTQSIGPSATVLDYYVFTVSPSAVSAQFQVVPVDGDVGLVLSYGLPLPTRTQALYTNDLPGIATELITVDDLSNPIALQPGDWYLGVYNKSAQPVTYQVRASEALDARDNIIHLTNGVPVNFTLRVGNGLTNFFQLRVPNDPPSVKFELSGLSGDADLLVGYNSLPTPGAYLQIEPASRLIPATIELRTNQQLPELRGNWVVAVINQTITNLTFTLRGSFAGPTNAPPSTNEVSLGSLSLLATGRLQFVWPAEIGAAYELQVTTNLLPVVIWTPVTNLTAQTDSVSVSDPTSVTNAPMRFYRVVKR
ncbi:MAG: hypothetical protein U1G07_26220 [Verrucomicrobiota bacterium]